MNETCVARSSVLPLVVLYSPLEPSLSRSADGEAAPEDVGRVSAGFCGKRATEKIYAPACVTRRITGVSAESSVILPRAREQRLTLHVQGWK